MACRELGLSAGEPANFGAGTLPLLVSNVTCKGTEGRLASCQYLIGKPCPAGGAAGVRCQSERPHRPAQWSMCTAHSLSHACSSQLGRS